MAAILSLAAAGPASAAKPPDVPKKLRASAGNGTVTLTWDAAGGGPKGYYVYRGTSGGSWTKLASTAASTRTYQNGGLTNGVAYTYIVTAFNDHGESGASNQVSATPVGSAPPPPPPPPPTPDPPPPSCTPSTSSNYKSVISGTAGLAGYWRLGEASGTTAADATGRNPGTYAGGYTLGAAGALTGDADTATALDGSTGYVSVPNSASLTLGDSFSVEAWVKRGALDSTRNQVIASKQSGSWVLMFDGQNHVVLRRSNYGDVATSSSTVTDTVRWHHIVATKAGSSVHLYVDGTDVTGTVADQAMVDNVKPFVIGESSDTAYFNGAIDEVAVYSGSLTAAQVAAHYSAAAGSTTPCTSASYSSMISGTAGLAAYWRLGEPSGVAAADVLGRNAGTYMGGYRLGVAGGLGSDPDTAAGFDGLTGYVSVPNSPSLTLGDSFSVEAWIKRGSVSSASNQVIASKQAGDWVLMVDSANNLVLRRSGIDDVAASTVPITDTTRWHHVVATKNGSSVHLYIDGADVTGTVNNQTMTDNANPLVIGQSSATAFFNGTIDEVAVYAGPLTPSQVADHYRAGSATSSPSSSDPVIAAAGDIACGPSDGAYNGGAGTSDECRQRYTSDLLVNSGLSAVLPLGDNQYGGATLSAFRSVYDPTWGRVKSISHPIVGNHDYDSSSTASGYFDYFNGVGASNGPAGPRGQGWYSWDIGGWHMVALNSECGEIGGCGVGSAEEQWLRADLAAHPARCTLAYWHEPLFNSGYTGNATQMRPIWQDLYDAGADVVLSGHSHTYERFGPQTASGSTDSARGIREFVVGTGGEEHHALGTVQPHSEAVNASTFGVLKMTLHSGSYDWRFVPEAGRSFTDSGTASCH